MSATATSPATDLTDYEARQVKEIAAWKAEHPGLWTEMFRVVAHPLARAAEKLIPDRAASEAIEAVFKAAAMTDQRAEIERRAGVSDLSELQHRPLEECDRLAREVVLVAEGIATAEGVATGAGGVFTTLIDIPLFFTLALRTIMRIGHCYGYPLARKTDEAYVLGVLAAALSGSRERKQKILVRLREIEELLLEETQENLVVEEAAALLFQLEIFEEIPGVGALSGGLLNFSAMNRTARTAGYLFQQRWLRDNGKVHIIEPAVDIHPVFSSAHWSGVFARAAYLGFYRLSFGLAFPVYLVAPPLCSLRNVLLPGPGRDSMRRRERPLSGLEGSS